MRFGMVAALVLTPLLAKDNEPAKRLDEAEVLFSEVMAAPDKGIPQELLENAHCIVIVPDLKTGAFIPGNPRFPHGSENGTDYVQAPILGLYATVAAYLRTV